MVSTSLIVGSARRRQRAVAFVGLAVMLGLVLLACTDAGAVGGQPAVNAPPPAAQPTAAGSTQTSAGGGVTVKVTWQGPSVGPSFQIALDTHSGTLDDLDLRELAVLRTDDGREVRPSDWTAPAGGHHRSGALVFPATTADGSPTIGPATREIELVVRGIAGVAERTFRWQL